MRANEDGPVRGKTDGEMKAREIASSLFNQTAFATSEDLRWGMLWSVLVYPGVQMMAVICSDGLDSA